MAFMSINRLHLFVIRIKGRRHIVKHFTQTMRHRILIDIKNRTKSNIP
jgi:hypothetical protein